jgi:glutathione peroxidase-family protein
LGYFAIAYRACTFNQHPLHLQYNELVELDKKYKDLVIIGAPCNQFGSQEPGTNAEIKKFAAARGAKFPMLSKLDVNGTDGALPSMTAWLSEKAGEAPFLNATDPKYPKNNEFESILHTIELSQA